MHDYSIFQELLALKNTLSNINEKHNFGTLTLSIILRAIASFFSCSSRVCVLLNCCTNSSVTSKGFLKCKTLTFKNARVKVLISFLNCP